ncbi:LOW QUALITY PROTEIN: hypothetical protein ACG7TL_002573 [Trametes sanguinea]
MFSNADVSPDGYQRAAVVANGVMPGPLITGQKGDEFKINVINNLTNHTMLKSTSINPAEIHTLNSDPPGTFWYHSHLSTQYCDGLRGPLVVYDPNDPHADLYDVDNGDAIYGRLHTDCVMADDTVITLADWYHAAAKVGPKFPVRTDSTLINGRGRTAATIAAELTVITVTPGKRYRFRLVSISCDPAYTFSIDGHGMTVIEADSVNTQPLEVDSIPIYAGQRYSFVVEANQPVDNYWIRANPMAGTTGFEGGINSAILRYEGAPEQEPTTTPSTSTKPLKETDLHPLVSMPVPGSPVAGGVDKAINMAFQFDGTNFFINGATFKPPTTPVLLQILSGAQAASDLLPSGDVYVLPSNATIELSFPATIQAGAPHPFHLHGHTFAVVRSAGSTEYNYENPIFRDVVSTGVPEDSDNVTIRFRTDNPGPWFLHCHIDFHLEAGFAVIMAEDTPDTKTDNPVPPQLRVDLLLITNNYLLRTIMTADYKLRALEDPTLVVRELYRTHTSGSFPRFVADHFKKLFESQNAFRRIPILDVARPPESHRDRALVRFRGMVQDTSLSTEMYLSKYADGSCGGWGIYETEGGSSSSARDVNYADLEECSVLWATSVPAESTWCADELDGTGHAQRSLNPRPAVVSQRAHKYPHAQSQHLGVQVKVRDELIAWIAEEALGGDRVAAEWVLLSCIARVQSRNPPLLPPSLVISRFPPPPPVPSTTSSAPVVLPTLATVLQLLLPLAHTLPLSLDTLNKSQFAPESKDEDLHAGVLQLPQGTVLLVTEGGVREGQLLERGIFNVRALQDVMDAQTLAYVFPYSQFSFPTDISCIVLSEGRKSTFFRTDLNVPLRVPTNPDGVAALYKPAEEVKLPSAERLAAFRDLIVGARGGKVQVPETTSEDESFERAKALDDARISAVA